MSAIITRLLLLALYCKLALGQKNQVKKHGANLDKIENELYLDYSITLQDVIAANPGCFTPRTGHTRAMAFEAQTSETYTAPPKPFINLGMPKAGSTTLYDFFHCAGYTTSHWTCPGSQMPGYYCGMCMINAVQENKPPLKSCGNKDAFMQLDITDMRLNSKSHRHCVFPQHEFLEEIHAEAPNATFILPFREMEAWVKSIEAWGQKYNYDYIGYLDRSCPYEGLLGGIEASITAGKVPSIRSGHISGRMAQFVCDHVTRVRDFVRKHPSHTLIEYELEKGSTSNFMLDIFKVENRECWGRSNFNQAAHFTGHLRG